MYAPARFRGGAAGTADTHRSPSGAVPFTGRCIVSIHGSGRRTGGDEVLEFAILGLLQQSPMHGYELRKELAQLLGGLRSISFGSLSPALKRLHAAGYIPTADPDPKAPLPA